MEVSEDLEKVVEVLEKVVEVVADLEESRESLAEIIGVFKGGSRGHWGFFDTNSQHCLTSKAMWRFQRSLRRF